MYNKFFTFGKYNKILLLSPLRLRSGQAFYKGGGDVITFDSFCKNRVF